MTPDGARLRQLLGGPAYAKLFAAVRRRLEEAGEAARSVTVDGLDVQEAHALADVLGWRAAPDGAVRVELAALDRALAESAASATLREVLEALGGPIRDARSERDHAVAERERLWSDAEARVSDRPELLAWLAGLRASGGLTRAAGAAAREPLAVLHDAVTVALSLPAPGRLLAVLAAACTGDPHALDAGTPLGGLVLRAAAALAGWERVPSGASERRRLWREVGVDCDALSAEVLVVGLRPAGASLLARHLREAADAGEPRRVTLRELARAGVAVAPGTVVSVCENPAVVAAAAEVHGGRCGALVCVEGVPSTAAMELVRALAACGAALRVHADLDWAGLRIARQVIDATGGAPWRFDARAYVDAVARVPRGPRLLGGRVDSPWDPGLAAAMAEHGVAIPEEQVLPELLGDLAA
ncbi:MAG: TIGR02679 family protein [Anaeromyxobacteraceae bacterium]